MNSKRLFFLLTVLSLTSIAFGQEDKNKEKKEEYQFHSVLLHSEDTAVVNGTYKVGWVRSHFFDSWFFQLQGGGQLYYGTEDTRGPLGDRLTGNAEFLIGRRIFPMFGFRLGAGLGYAHGFLSKDTYNGHNVNTNGNGQCDPVGGGYYTEYDNDLLMQNWKYYFFGVDLFLELDFFKGSENYDPDRKVNHIVYFGVRNFTSTSEVDKKNRRTEGHLGYVCKYNFNKNWSVFGDIRLNFMERLFDREHVTGVESSGFGLDPVLNFNAGISYKFHIRTDKQRNNIEEGTTEKDPNAISVITYSYIKQDTIVKLIHTDTAISYVYEHKPTDRTQRALDSLSDEINKRKADPNYRALDSMMLNRLLPYEMVFFELDRWEILPSEEGKIRKMAQVMKSYPDQKFILTGSADSKTGSKVWNVKLSQNRVDVVYYKLIRELGVNPDQLERRHLGGILKYNPFELNRCTVIIMDHPIVQKAFREMEESGEVGGGSVNIQE